MSSQPENQKTNSLDETSNKIGEVLRCFNNATPRQYLKARIKDFRMEDINLHKLGYCLRGTTGIGKTHLATSLAYEYLVSGAVELRSKYNLVWLSSPMLQVRLRSSFRQGSRESEHDIISELSKSSILVLDDFGAEKKSEYAIASLYALLSERLNNLRVTIITTNLTLADINKIDPRIASRFGELGEIKLPKTDRRLK